MGPVSPAVQEVWLVCHGYRQLAADFLSPFSVLDNGRRLIVAPEGLSRFYYRDAPRAIGASWMTREDRLHEIEDYVSYLDRLHDALFERIDRSRTALHVLGFSQGTATVSRWLSRGTRVADRLTLWGGLLAPELLGAEALVPFRQMHVSLVVGTKDTLVHDADIAENVERLAGQGITTEVIRFPGGHRLSRQVMLRLAGEA